MTKSSKIWLALLLSLPFFAATSWETALAQAVNFGINLSGGKEPVKIDADNMEVHDKDGLAILTGNVSVEQGDRVLRSGKMVVYYDKTDKTAPQADMNKERKIKSGIKQTKANGAGTNGLGAKGISKLEISGKVYIQNGKQIAVGDNGIFNAKDNVMVLTGQKVILTDSENVATGCKLIAHMDTGKAFLESCSSSRQKGRVSVIVNRDGEK